MDELKSCPFCGGTDILVHERTCDRNTPYNPNDRAAPTVRCGGCFASVFGQDWTGPDTAITAWNTRPREDAGVVDDDLRQRCADILTWRKTGSLPFGTALRRFADDRRFDRHETDRLRAAEDATLHEAATALAAALGKSNG